MVLFLIIFYHVYTYAPVFSKVEKTKKVENTIFTASAPKPKSESHSSVPIDDDIHRFNEMLDIIDCPVNTSDYKKKPVQKPTQSIVEMHHLQLAPHDPEEANSHVNQP